MKSRHSTPPRRKWFMPLSCCWLVIQVLATGSNSSPFSNNKKRFTLPGRPYENDDSEKDSGWMGAGREFNVFDNRGGEESSDSSDDPIPQASHPKAPYTTRAPTGAWGATEDTSTTATRSHYSSRSSSTASSSSSRRSYRSKTKQKPDMFQTVQEWWSTTIGENVKSWPKLQIRVEPTTTIKIRKSFHPLKTIVRLGAEFNTQLGVWQFKSSWEDAIIGGKLTLKGRELQLSKSWQLSVGAVDDLVTRLRFRAAVDLGTMKAYARVGFRTERLSPINVAEGFTVIKRLPLVGKDGKAKLEVKANFALPEPEIEYSTESNRSMVGMGDIEVNIEELNLLLDY